MLDDFAIRCRLDLPQGAESLWLGSAKQLRLHGACATTSDRAVARGAALAGHSQLVLFSGFQTGVPRRTLSRLLAASPEEFHAPKLWTALAVAGPWTWHLRDWSLCRLVEKPK